MPAWNPQRFLNAGRKAKVSENILANAVAIASTTSAITIRNPPIFSLGHLSYMTDLDVSYLRGLVSRNGDDPYREFKIRKRPVPGHPPRFRFIAVPEPRLMELQRWISKEILSHAPCHPASTAYSPGSQLVNAAKRHTGAKWLIKIDVRDFFESITEIDVYRVFLERGYQPLTSLELARICTRLRDEHREPGVPLPRRRRAAHPDADCITAYYSSLMGTLAQGAPTSPMLANLASKRLDETVQAIAQKFSVRYTRYADDLTFSTTEKAFGRARAAQLVGEVYAALGGQGLSPNTSKTLIFPPGARKIVLGLLVDGKQARLSREFRSKMRMHLHYLTLPDVGPRQLASKRGFASAEGLRQHLLGLIAFAGQIDPAYADTLRTQFATLDWS